MPLRGLDANGAERQSRSRSPMVADSPLTLSIIVPAFNEERRLAATLATLCEYLGRQPWDWEVRVVDDGLGDDTAGMAGRSRRPSREWSCSASRTGARAGR